MMRHIEKVSCGSLFLFLWPCETVGRDGGFCMSLEEKIMALAAPIADELGIQVLKVVVAGGRSVRQVRLIADKRGGIDSDLLERLSRGLSLQLDVEDLVPGQYRLEISSPGLDWPLTTAADFERYEGEWIQVQLEDGSAIEGENRGPVEAGFCMTDDKGNEHVFELAGIVRVTRAVNWQQVSRKPKKK